MSREERTDIPQVLVNEPEYRKFCYLIKVTDAIDRAHGLANKSLHEMKTSEGIQGYMDYNWSDLVRYLTPELHLVFLQDRERDPYTQQFMKYPFAAIVVRTAYIVELESEFELSLGDTDTYQGVNEVTNAFRVLEATVQTLGGRRLMDGERTLNQLRRLLKLEL